jgi:type II secretory pathway predicted ATPase ExeA
MGKVDGISAVAGSALGFTVVEHQPLVRARRLVQWAASDQQMIKLVGGSGTGKTTAAVDAAALAGAELDQRAVRVTVPHRPDPKTLYRYLATQILGSCPERSKDQLEQLITAALRAERLIVVIDEAQNLNVAGLERLRTLWELSPFAGVLVGDKRLYKLLEGSPQLDSRIARTVEFDFMRGPDLWAFLRTWNPMLEQVTDQALNEVERRVCQGNLRRWEHWLGALREVLTLTGCDGPPTADHLDAATLEVR